MGTKDVAATGVLKGSVGEVATASSPRSGVHRYCDGAMKRARCEAADAVLGNSDLLKLILLNRIGPTQFSLLRRVSKAFRDLLDSDDELLRGTLTWQGGMTKTDLRSFMCLDRNSLEALPCERKTTYFLYREPAIKLLTKPGCAAALAARRAGPAGKKLRAQEAAWRSGARDRPLGAKARMMTEAAKSMKFGPGGNKTLRIRVSPVRSLAAHLLTGNAPLYY